MKEKKVCKGCRYLIGKGNGQLEGTCSYCAVNGKSRMLIEIANGGIQTDSCICYEKKGNTNEKKSKAFLY